ncbi:MAG: NAD(P)/FAD-dependent oxidoreductase, partial [Betaproteobacteria bacterium]|nr:NAD(P)/FAD-dependent oxidoreductase [Betaproteobacteria bacterium]
EARLDDVQPRHFTLEGEASQADGVTEAWFTFETRLARGRGHLRLINGRAWTMLTTMVELKGHEEKKGNTRVNGVEHGPQRGRKTWLESRSDEARTLGYTEQPYVVIIGGGQAGIILGARLRKLGVPTIIVEKNARAGDSWRNRYKSLCLHDPVWYDHLPYLPFPEDWPVFAPKDKLGDWLEMYVKVMELNYWNATSCKKARYNEARGEWEVTVEREGRELVLKPKELVVALGVSGYPNVPHFEGAEAFLGDQFHSSKFPGAEAYRGKKALVLGSNNSAHDICAALWEEGVDTTMIQRSSTHIAPSDSLMELALGGLYSEAAVKNGIDCHKADLIFASIPYKVMAPLQVPVYDEMKKRDALLFERLDLLVVLLSQHVDRRPNLAVNLSQPVKRHNFFCHFSLRFCCTRFDILHTFSGSATSFHSFISMLN